MAHRYDLHLHSCASHDCKTAFSALIRMSRRRGLAGLALTDHDTMDGVTQLQRLWPTDELHLIAGCERTLFDGSHIIGLFLKSAPQSDRPRDLITEIHDQGGLVYLPHPFRYYSGVLGGGSAISPSDRDWILENTDIVEVFNRKCSAAENTQALELLDQSPKSSAASSDAHYAFEIGHACTEFAVPLSPASFQSSACYAPSNRKAEQIVTEMRRAQEPAPQAAAKSLLKALGFFQPVKDLRNYLRSLREPTLEKYP